MPELKSRDTQTKVKHEILDEYLIKWGSIITSGVKGSIQRYPNMRTTFNTRFIYIDYFSFSGIYEEDGAEVYGSPILGIQALDKIQNHFHNQTDGLTPSVIAILFEEKQSTYTQLLDTLEKAGYVERIKRTNDLSSLKDKDIAVIKGDSAQYVDRILDFINHIDSTFSFHFIDPYGQKGVEQRNIEKIVSKKGADCIINMMLNSASRWMSLANKPDNELNPGEQAHIRFLDDFFGSSEWRKIASEIKQGNMSRENGEQALINHYDAILRGADPSLTVKKIPLNFQDRDQILYTLFLTTHDPTGAFTMNEILADAHINQYDYREHKRQMKSRPGQMKLSFFDEIPDTNRPIEPEVDIDGLVEEIYKSCHSRQLKFRDILRIMSDSAYFVSDIREALGELKKQKRASFESAPSRLTNNSEVKFV